MGESFKVRVWAVLGEGATGKTAIIGNLISRLGRGPGGFRPVPLRGGGYLQIYARRQSLQEARRSPEQVVSDTLKVARDLQKKHAFSICYLNLLVAIRTDVIRGLPPASYYLSHFVQSGWSLESLVILDYEVRKHFRYYAFGAPICEHYDASDMVRDKAQHHWLLGPVRNHFGWA
jgi:hypothetical protein